MTTNFLNSKPQSTRSKLSIPNHPNEWNDRFWLGRISDVLPEISCNFYLVKRAYSGFLTARTDIRSAVSLSSNSLLKSRPNTGISPKIINLEKEIFNLKSKVDISYDSKSVPDFHKNLFRTFLSLLKDPNLQLEALKTELSNLKRNSAPIICVISAIKVREALLQKLKEKISDEDLARKDLSKSLFLLEIGELIKEIRLKSLDVVDSIKIWKSCLQMPAAKFIWNDEEYFEIMKKDYQFIIESPVAKSLNFPAKCTTFFIQLKTQRNEHFGQESRNFFKVNPQLQARILSAYHTLGIEVTKISLVKKRKVRQSRNPTIQLNFNFQVSSLEERPSQWESTDSEEETQSVMFLASELEEQFLFEYSDKLTIDIVSESCREMISASLVLFSSSVLDKYITEVLAQQIHQVAMVAYQETTDSEYIDFQLQIIQDAMEEILLESSQDISSCHLAELISSVMSDDLNFSEIAQAAIDEENSWNVRIIVLIFEELVRDLLEEEWFEIFIEDTLSYTRLDDMWNILPLSAQKQLYKTDREKIHNKMAEDIYFEILNNVVGDVWTLKIAWAVKNNEDDDSMDKIFPVREERSAKRRNTRINLPSYN